MLDICMLKKLNIERPELGSLSLPRVHKTSRPKPTVISSSDLEPTPGIPDFKDRPVPKNYEKFGPKLIFEPRV